MSLSKKYKVVLITIAIIAVCGYYSYQYIYQKHKSIDDLEVAFSGTAAVFLDKIKQDAIKWQNVIVELEGIVSSIDDKGFVCNENIYCQWDVNFLNSEIKTGQIIKIKGRMMGYDDLLEEIKIDQTKIINK